MLGDPFSPDFVALVMAEFHINYRASVRFDDHLDIALAVSDVGRCAFRAGFRMSVADRLCAEGYGVHVGFYVDELRAAPLPEASRAELEAEQV